MIFGNVNYRYRVKGRIGAQMWGDCLQLGSVTQDD